VLSGPQRLSLDWLRTRERTAVPFLYAAPTEPGRGPVGAHLAGRLVAAARMAGAENLLACRTDAGRFGEPITALPTAAAELVSGLREFSGTDFLLAQPDVDNLLLITTAGFGIAAGIRPFVEGVLGAAADGARREFAAAALERAEGPLLAVAVFCGCPFSQRPWSPEWQAWATPAEAPPGSGVRAQADAMRAFVTADIAAAEFERLFLAGRRQEIEHGERATGPLAEALDVAFWSLTEHGSGAGPHGLPDDVALDAAIRRALERLDAVHPG
jgi:hypothetical protein